MTRKFQQQEIRKSISSRGGPTLIFTISLFTSYWQVQNYKAKSVDVNGCLIDVNSMG